MITSVFCHMLNRIKELMRISELGKSTLRKENIEYMQFATLCTTLIQADDDDKFGKDYGTLCTFR